jgi:predicted PurR-regulated permease PerM
METDTQKQAWFWGGAFALFFIGFIWLFRDVLTPFVLGIVIAYLLNPLVQYLTRWKGVNRSVVAVFILTMFTLVITLVLLLIVPPAAREAGNLIEKMPAYLDIVINWLRPHIAWAQQTLGDNYPENAETLIKENADKVLAGAGGIAAGLATGGQAIAGFLTTLVLTPLVAFFMMKEWPRMTEWVENLIPRDETKMVRDLLRQIDRKISGFIRGQLTVAFFLGLLYAIALSIAGLNYGFLIGLSAGVFSIIPLVGSTLGLIVSIVVAWFQSGDLSYVAIIAAIFFTGQFVEGNFLSPKLVGDSVGLHPLWVIFAVFAGGALFGILGMLLAVPVAAIVGVLGGFAILQYKNTDFYKKTPADPKKDKKA